MKRIIQQLIVAFSTILLFLISCGRKEKSGEFTTVTETPDSATVSLSKFSENEIFKEVKLRVEGTNKSTTEKNGNHALSRFTTQELLNHLLVIYGQDDRKNLYDSIVTNNTHLLQDAQKVACVVYRDQLKKKDADTYVFKNYAKYIQMNGQEICREEAFYGEPVISFCTAFAVEKRLMVTAGHCIDGEDLSKIAFVYGYYMKDPATPNLEIPVRDIYYPVKIKKISPANSAKSDFCLIEINKDISSQRIASIRTQKKIGDNDSVHVIGYPCGLPLKFSLNAAVINNTDPDFFKTNLDTYQGNSGSPVFNSRTHIVEGILVRGDTDFVIWPLNACNRSKRCWETADNCTGEAVSRISQFISHINKTAPAKRRIRNRF